jgi:hypothetical protein
MITKITELLARCGTASTIMPPTELYNEGWMLRLMLDWLDQHREVDHPLAFLPKARWYSEALLPSRFKPRQRGDRLAESFTHADGVIGHFEIAPGERGAAALHEDAQQFVVCEAKLGSGLSLGTTNAASFDQAARNVACMAHMIGEARVRVGQLSRLAFCVIAPEKQIEARVFRTLVTKESVRVRVGARVAQYEDADMDEWCRAVFEPVLEAIDLRLISWEALLDQLPSGPEVTALGDFYARCLAVNPLRMPYRGSGRQPTPIDSRPLCRRCAEEAFRQWRGWCAHGLDDPPPVPEVPRVVDGYCSRCRATVGIEPAQVGYVNVHGEFSTGLPDFFELRILESAEQVAESQWGIPYLDSKVGRVPIEELPKRYPPRGWRRRTMPFDL